MENNNETTTYSARIKTTTKEEIQNLIQTYSQEVDEATAEDFFRLLIDTYKAHSLTSNIIDVKADIKELNQLTSRIYGMYTNLIERNNTNMENIKMKAIEQVEESKNTINSMQDEIDKHKDEVKEYISKIDSISKNNADLLSEISELKEIRVKDDKLILKLEEEIDSLKEIEKTNAMLSTAISKLQNEVNNLKEINNDLQGSISAKDMQILNLNKQIADIKINAENKIEQIISRAEINKQQEILKLKQLHQVELQDKNNEIQDIKLKKIQDIEKLQDKYIQQIEKLKSSREIQEDTTNKKMDKGV